MVVTPIPQISASDYPHFRRLCLGLPKTHAAWESSQRRYHRKHGTSSERFVPVTIEPIELEAYWQHDDAAPTVDALYGLAIEKFRRPQTG